MNDPWPRMIDALLGKRCPLAATWPSRRVHRVEGYVPDPEAPRRRALAGLKAMASRPAAP